MGRSTLPLAIMMFVTSVLATAPTPCAAGPGPVPVDQGPDWTPDKRDKFYSLDQGSRIMPLSWIRALTLPDGSPFMKDSLRRYGFLPNANPDMLPVGFTAAGQPRKVGLTCAACHTRQIEYSGTAYRIDGGPAMIDFQRFVSDLDIAVGRVLNDSRTFAHFANAVLGVAHTSADKGALRQELDEWYYRYHILMSNALPKKSPWGAGRLDAIAMIFNRLAGLDLGPAPRHVIKENIKRAEAPARYPFLWNASKQVRTQWTGFVPDNTDPNVQLARNMGQVIGVFADFIPKKDASGEINYWITNSMQVDNLRTLEKLTMSMGPPRWPWALDNVLADQGEGIFKRECSNGCHEIHELDGNENHWDTPITPVTKLRTDFRELQLMQRTAFSGVLGPPKNDMALTILLSAVIGSVSQINPASKIEVQRGAFVLPPDAGYEARVLQGVWAAAPYLHNGSVPTLAELLKPSDKRTASFKVGPAYDPAAVGLAVEQPHVRATLKTTDCRDRSSGNSRCGHEFGTTLPDSEKRALLEYLKRL